MNHSKLWYLALLHRCNHIKPIPFTSAPLSAIYYFEILLYKIKCGRKRSGRKWPSRVKLCSWIRVRCKKGPKKNSEFCEKHCAASNGKASPRDVFSVPSLNSKGCSHGRVFVDTGISISAAMEIRIRVDLETGFVRKKFNGRKYQSPNAESKEQLRTNDLWLRSHVKRTNWIIQIIPFCEFLCREIQSNVSENKFNLTSIKTGKKFF